MASVVIARAYPTAVFRLMMGDMAKYEPRDIEPKWQKKWLEERVYEPDLDKAKKPFYNLMMFPYPSAEGFMSAICTLSRDPTSMGGKKDGGIRCF